MAGPRRSVAVPPSRRARAPSRGVSIPLPRAGRRRTPRPRDGSSVAGGPGVRPPADPIRARHARDARARRRDGDQRCRRDPHERGPSVGRSARGRARRAPRHRPRHRRPAWPPRTIAPTSSGRSSTRRSAPCAPTRRRSGVLHDDRLEVAAWAGLPTSWPGRLPVFRRDEGWVGEVLRTGHVLAYPDVRGDRLHALGAVRRRRSSSPAT